MSSSDNLSIINPDCLDSSNVICTPPAPISNMSFDEAIEFRYSDYVSSDTMEVSDETDDWDKILTECSKRERERDDAYDLTFQQSLTEKFNELYPPIPPMAEPKTSEKIDYKKIKELCGEDVFIARKFYAVKDKIGDGKMEYIPKEIDRVMCTNAWKAITFSNNWDFVAEDIDSFAFSRDPRIDEITKKMEEFGYYGHSGMSFGCTMRNMQYLVKHGEEEFKKLFVLDKLESTV